MFRKLLEVKGVRRGKGGDRRSNKSTPTMGVVARELGVPLKTAEKRLAKADVVDGYRKTIAAEVTVHASRRLGELLEKQIQHGGDRKSSSACGNLKLKELGISGNESSRWQIIAKPSGPCDSPDF